VTLIVSDNSPLNLLIRIDWAEVLPALFQRIVIPTEVAAEMAHPKAPSEVRAFIAAPPTWLDIQIPATRLLLPHLDPAEASAINLAVEMGAALLIDELDGRHEAQARGLIVIGAIGVLERAADSGFIPDLAAAHARIRSLRFHIADSILNASLQRHHTRMAQTQIPTPAEPGNGI